MFLTKVPNLARQIVGSQCLHTTAARFDTQKTEKKLKASWPLEETKSDFKANRKPEPRQGLERRRRRFRRKLGARKLNPNEIFPSTIDQDRSDGLLVDYLNPKPPPAPSVPRYPLSIQWDLRQLLYEVDEEPVIKFLSVWNVCSRTIYIHCCGLWGESARLGASWRCCPQTRFHLAPGMASRLAITATPRMSSPIPTAYADLQLAAAHKRDHISSYYAVPVLVKFLNYSTPCAEEAG